MRSNVAGRHVPAIILCDALIATNRVETLKPDGALYAFLKIDECHRQSADGHGDRRSHRRRARAEQRDSMPVANSSCAPASCATPPRSKSLPGGFATTS